MTDKENNSNSDSFGGGRKKKKARSDLILALVLGLVIGLSIHFFFFPLKANPDQNPSPIASSDKPKTDQEASGKASQAGDDSSEMGETIPQTGSGLEEEPQEEDPDPSEGGGKGKAQGQANTGDFVQDAGGTGTNHNRAASIYAYPVDKVNQAMFGGDPLAGDHKMAFLTFDDGPHPDSTPELLDILAGEGVPASFFLVGRYMDEASQPLIQRMLDEGHGLAFHSYSHDYGYLYPNRNGNAQHIAEEARRCQKRLEELIGSSNHVSVWRYPGGHMSWNHLEEADAALEGLGLEWIDWNTTCGDALGQDAPRSPQGQIQTLLSDWAAYGYPDCITVLLHDTPDKPVTRAAIPGLVKTLRDKGFSFGILE